ncbi:MAG TPA: hypothetical protein ENF58_04070 [Candidatus Altiarchaeales archaeon]|nr:hypothetical protein [Candidatus Altiarchaeales archaeon]
MELLPIVMGTVGIILYMLIPGISLSLALFPRREDLDLVERVGIGIFLGMTTPFIQYFNDKNFFIPINFTTTTATILVVTIIGLLVWQLRLRRMD